MIHKTAAELRDALIGDDPDVTAVEWISALLTDVKDAIAEGDWEQSDPESMAECLANVERFVQRARAAIAKATGEAVTT